MTPQVLAIVAGVSSVLAVISLIAYYVALQRSKLLYQSEKSVKSIVEGEGLSDTSSVIAILREFRGDEDRLAALKLLVAHSKLAITKADRIYEKIKGGVDIHALEGTRYLHIQRISRWTLSVFVILAVIAAIYGYRQLDPIPKPSISHAQLFNEAHSTELPGTSNGGARPRHTLTKLEERSGNSFQIEKAEDFLLGLGFVLRGLSISPDGGMDTLLTVTGLPNDGGDPAWVESALLSHRDRWKSFDIPKATKPENVLLHFGLKNGEAIPIAVIIECFSKRSLMRWSGRIQIQVIDHQNHDAKAELKTPLPLALSRPTEVTESGKVCQ